jgi:hypothetical protein
VPEDRELPAAGQAPRGARSAPAAAGRRISWPELPDAVRAFAEEALGSPVVSARTQPGGFSPGVAARLTGADGSAAFVKACGTSLNPDSPRLHRAEIHALRHVPRTVPRPELLAAYDDGDWVAMLLEDVDGRHPGLPWTAADVAATTASLTRLAAVAGDPSLPAFRDVAELFTGWDAVAADPDGVPPDLVRRLPELLDLQARAQEVTAGEVLVHWDARSDNVLLRDGEAVLLDWAWACRGAGWLDTLLLAVDLVVQGGPDPDDYLRASGPTAAADRGDVRAVVATMVGFWLDRAGHPAPPGLPTIRRWQAHCADTVQAWLERSDVLAQ